MSRLRKLAKLVYDQVKHLPWRTVNMPTPWNPGLIDSPEVTVNGKNYDLRIKGSWPLEVQVQADGRVLYPGGTYHRYWPWAWEREVFDRVAQDRSYELKIIPCDSVIDSDIAALTPAIDGAHGLTLIPLPGERNEKEPLSPDEPGDMRPAPRA